MMEITRRGREGNWFRFLGSSWGTAPFQAPFSVSFFLPSSSSSSFEPPLCKARTHFVGGSGLRGKRARALGAARVFLSVAIEVKTRNRKGAKKESEVMCFGFR